MKTRKELINIFKKAKNLNRYIICKLFFDKGIELDYILNSMIIDSKLKYPDYNWANTLVALLLSKYSNDKKIIDSVLKAAINGSHAYYAKDWLYYTFTHLFRFDNMFIKDEQTLNMLLQIMLNASKDKNSVYNICHYAIPYFLGYIKLNSGSIINKIIDTIYETFQNGIKKSGYYEIDQWAEAADLFYDNDKIPEKYKKELRDLVNEKDKEIGD